MLLGAVFLLGAFDEVLIASARPRWRWAHILMGAFFAIGAVWSFTSPFDAFWSLA